MADSRTLFINGIGPVLLARSKRARRIIIYVKSPEIVRVAVPGRVSYKSALEFVNTKIAWIKNHQAILRRMENKSKSAISPVIDKIEAKKRLTIRLRHLAEKYGFTFNKLTIRSQRTRWGSCSHKNNISLNMKLVRLPEELIDYVLLHELVHTRIHDHSKSFWAEMDRYVSNSKKVASRIRNFAGFLK